MIANNRTQFTLIFIFLLRNIFLIHITYPIYKYKEYSFVTSVLCCTRKLCYSEIFLKFKKITLFSYIKKKNANLSLNRISQCMVHKPPAAELARLLVKVPQLHPHEPDWSGTEKMHFHKYCCWLLFAPQSTKHCLSQPVLSQSTARYAHLENV